MRGYQDRFDIPRAYSDWKEMLRVEALDAVSVCTPNRLHERAAIDAMKAGCEVLCEKPLAHSAKAGERMLAASRDLGRKLVIGFQYRFNPRTQFLRAAADDGQFGKILYTRVKALRRRGIPNWGVFGQKELQGGGPLIDIGVHVLEMAHYTMGSPEPVTASADMFTYIGNKPSSRVESAWKGWDYKTYTVEDLAVGRVRFDTSKRTIGTFKSWVRKVGRPGIHQEFFETKLDTWLTHRLVGSPRSPSRVCFHAK